ncbi:MAG: hypothetical protein RR356_03295 [Bacteroidales bacterium]
MKKNILTLVVATIVAITFSSCGDEPKTYTELLTISKGWVLSSATSSPAYELSNNTFATNLITDGYLSACEVDDIIKFTANGGETIEPGKTNCSSELGYGYTKSVAATWKFNAEETHLFFQIPFFYNAEGDSYDKEQENVEILSLTETELRVKYTFDDVTSPAKTKYSFTLTYVPAK